MKKFKFKLETVLKERKRIEDLKLREFALSSQMLQKLNVELDSYKQTLARAILDTTNLVNQPVNQSGNIGVADGFISGTKIRISWKEYEVQRAEKFTERKRLEYVAARQKREALEKLKLKRELEHKQALRKKETKEMDDLYVMRANSPLSDFTGDEL